MSNFNPLAELLNHFIKKNRSPEQHSRIANQFAGLLRQKGISCYCGGLAIPVESKGKIYRCVACEKQFANTYYDLTRYESYKPSYYSDAVEVLKNQ